jgi:transcriptional regulator
MPPTADLLPGTLDALILKAVSLERLHGYGVMMRIQQITRGAFRIEEGALYPALHRLEHQGHLAGEWGLSDNNRRAKYYRLTAAGRKRLAEAMHNWQRLAKAMELAFNAGAGEV